MGTTITTGKLGYIQHVEGWLMEINLKVGMGSWPFQEDNSGIQYVFLTQIGGRWR